MITKIDVVFIHSQNIGNLKKWYSEKLGIKPGYGDSHWQEFTMPEGSRFALDAVNESREGPESQKIIISFITDNIYEEVKRMSTAGVEFYPDAENTVFDAGPSLVATFKDLDGNWAQLSQRK